MSGKGFWVRRCIKVCVVLVGVTVFMACGSLGMAQTAKAVKPVTVGVIEPLTGPSAAGGKWLKRRNPRSIHSAIRLPPLT